MILSGLEITNDRSKITTGYFCIGCRDLSLNN